MEALRMQVLGMEGREMEAMGLSSVDTTARDVDRNARIALKIPTIGHVLMADVDVWAPTIAHLT